MTSSAGETSFVRNEEDDDDEDISNDSGQESVEAVVQRCSVKKVFLDISQNSQENNCARVFFLIKLQASGLQLN